MTSAHSRSAEIGATPPSSDSLLPANDQGGFAGGLQTQNTAAATLVGAVDWRNVADFPALDAKLCPLIPDLTAANRLALARTVATSPAPLPNAARSLALSEIDASAILVAAPGALDDRDLIEIARMGCQRRLEQIARRSPLSRAVTAVLVDMADDQVLNLLLANDQADLTETSLLRASERASSNISLRIALVRRQWAMSAGEQACPPETQLELAPSADGGVTATTPAAAHQPLRDRRTWGVNIWQAGRRRMPRSRATRYLLITAPVVGAIWLLTIGFLTFAPVRYASHMTLILPGAGFTGSMSVEKIGQASSVSASPFAGSSLSPTESYKRLLMSDTTLNLAAELLNQPRGSFPAPRVRLIDQTNLIEIDVSGNSATQAKERATALKSAFLATLEQLRRDEATKREAADRSFIFGLQVKARDAQAQLLAFQAQSGLVSIEQFNNRIGALDTLRDRENQQRTQERQIAATTARLKQSLGASPASAKQAMLLKADPMFQSLLSRYAAIRTTDTEKGATLGPDHVSMVELDAQSRSLRDALVTRGRALTGLPRRTLLDFADLSVAEGRAHLLEAMVTADSSRVGAAAALADIRQQLREQSINAGENVKQASMLAELTRDVRVAEAVFSSALARLDTNKSDPFASYPLVQTLEEPTLPQKRRSPPRFLVIAGAAGTTVMFLIGIGILWLRHSIRRNL